MKRKRYDLVATCFDKRKRVISSGANQYNKSHPLMKHFAELSGESDEKIYLHAELAALLAARGKEVDSVLVQRFDSEGSPRLAKPCKTCQTMLKAFGVRLVRYTTEEGVQEYEVQ